MYQVSDRGRVRSWNLIGRPGVKAEVPRITPARENSRGYLGVLLKRHGKSRHCAVHVLVLEAFVGPRPSKQVARHLNDVKTDNSICNLAWGTQKQNCLDRERNGNGRWSKRKVTN